MKGIITNKHALIKHKNTGEPSRIFCDRITYVHYKGDMPDHHLMFYRDGDLIFKVWLRHDKPYNSINEALEDVNMSAVWYK